MVGVLLIVFAESVLEVDYRWIAFVAVVGFVVLIPPTAYSDWRVMLPWELLVVALFPILVRGVFGGTVGTFASYFALAALALLIIVELHMFTSLSVTHWFAVVLVVLTTLAAVAAWTVFRWNADRYLGTSFLTDNEALMVEWLYVTLAGFAAGILFDGYFRRRDRQLRRVIRRVIRR
jgi:glucan phosphoethanolaminetransferase (alkaline phosphatase superfamily)